MQPVSLLAGASVDENREQLAGKLQHFVRSAAAAASHHLSTLVAPSERLK